MNSDWTEPDWTEPERPEFARSFNHEQIREQGLRAYGPALLAALLDPALPEDQRDEVEQTVAFLHDPRSLLTLRAVAEGNLAHANSVDEAVRRSAVRALGWTTAHPTGSELRAWWASDDPILKLASLPLMDRSEADILATILDDPEHPWLDSALIAIDFGCEEPEWQERKIRHLSHPSAEVRRAAAICCLWDEPIAAEPHLIALLDDPDPTVVEAAQGTLRYYASRTVVFALRDRGMEFADPADFFRLALDEPEPVSTRLREWMGEDLLALLPVSHEPEETLPDPAVLAAIGQQTMPVPRVQWDDEFEARVENADEPITALLEDLRNLDTDAVPGPSRGRIVELLCRNPDAERRERGAVLASVWGVAPAIVELFDDPVASVRKTAMYYAHDLNRNAQVADRALELLESGAVASTRAREALRTWVRHVDASTAVKRLIRFAREDRRETLVMSAIEELTTLDGGEEAIARLVDMVRRPPLANWAVHATLLDACARFRIDPGPVDHLRGFNDVWLAAALIRLDVALDR
jgi:hypothetical protein